MSPLVLRALLSRILTILLPLAIVSTVYLYLYPIFHGCAFPLPRNDGNNAVSSQWHAVLNTLRQHVTPASAPVPDSTKENEQDQKHTEEEPAIFRLLVLADPQLEGDSSLPNKAYELIPRIRHHWTSIRSAVSSASASTSTSTASSTGPSSLPIFDSHILSNITSAIRTLTLQDIPRSLRGIQKRIDLFGNDYYLAHVYRTLHWWSRPTHVTVLGDLVGSQWVSDEEFGERGSRFWGRVFRGGQRVGDHITITGIKGYEEEGGVEIEYNADDEDDEVWARRIINVAGNHDIGYAGDISEARIERFERVFGRVNWDVRFRFPLPHRQKGIDNDPETSKTKSITPTLHLINLNSLTLDTPALSPEIQSDSYAYINSLIAHRTYPVEDRTSFTLLLTHLPLHKQKGICTDGPHFTFHADDDNKKGGSNGTLRFKKGGLREQNHLSQHASANGILQGIFGLSGNENAPAGGRGRNGLILTGHDHVGCDVLHFVDRSGVDEEEEDAKDGDGDSPSTNNDENSDNEKEKPEWKWNAKRYTHNSPEPSTPSIREITLRSMMGEYGGNAGLLSIWFDPPNSATDGESVGGEWKYEITMCRAGVQHIWWAVHVLGIVCFGALVVWVGLGVVGCFSSSSSSSSSAAAAAAAAVGGSKAEIGTRTGNVTGSTKADSKKSSGLVGRVQSNPGKGVGEGEEEKTNKGKERVLDE